MRMRRKNKTNRDKLAEGNDLLALLLLSEASGGMIPLPRIPGIEGYKAPLIPITERRAILDSVNKVLLVGLKIDPEEEMTGFEILKEGLSERKRSRKSRSGGISSDSEATDGSGESESPNATSDDVSSESDA